MKLFKNYYHNFPVHILIDRLHYNKYYSVLLNCYFPAAKSLYDRILRSDCRHKFQVICILTIDLLPKYRFS